MKKLILALSLVVICTCLFTICVSATDFSSVTTDAEFDLTNMSTDSTARVVLGVTTVVEEEIEVTNPDTGEVTTQTVSKKVYSDCVTYPAQYIVKNSSKLTLDFQQINEVFTKSYDRYSILRIEIPTTVTSIEKGIFNSSSMNVLAVDIKGESISLKQDSFNSCKSLEVISIPETHSFAGYVFTSCSNLKTVNVAGDGLKSTGSERLFMDCSSLEYVKISPTITSFSNNAFNGCSSLRTEVDLSNVVDISSGAFRSCGLITFKNADKGLIKTVGQNAFSSCKGLTRIAFSEKLTSVGQSAFSGCTNLGYVEFNGGGINPETGEKYTFSLGNSAFANCTALSNVINLAGCTSVGDSAFRYCTAIPSFINTDSITTVSTYSFANLSITEISLPALTDLKGKEVFAWGSFEKITFGPNLTSVPGGDTFAYSDSIKELVFEGGVPTFGSSAFNRISSSAKLIFLGEVEEFAINSTKKAFSVYFINTSLDDISFKNDSYTTTYIKAYSCVDNKAIKFGTDGTVSDIEFVHLYEKTVSTDPDCVNPAKDSKLCYCGVAIEVVEGAAALGHDYGVEDLEIVGWNYNGDYYSDAKFVHICTVCSVEYDGEVNVGSALFTNLGYSSFTYEEGGVTKGSLVTRTQINTKAMQAYKAILTEDDTVLYGVYVGIYNNNTNPVNSDASANGVLICKLENTEYTNLELKVNGIGQDAFDTDLLCGAYMILNGKVAYLTNGNANDSAQIIKFNDFKE